MKRTTTVRSIALVSTALTALLASLFARSVKSHVSQNRAPHKSQRRSRR